jgi:hypothetical protein
MPSGDDSKNDDGYCRLISLARRLLFWALQITQ